MQSRAKLVVIVGPTGAGKSDVACKLAELADAEVVSADSQQVYRFMDIGTGKLDVETRARIPHHLIDIVDPDEDMTAARYAELADRAIAEIDARGRPAIVAGGTGLYVRALLLGLFQGPPADPEVRGRLDARAERLGIEALWSDLALVDPAAAERIHRTDQRRLVRALEVHELTGVPMSEHQRQHDHRRLDPRYRYRMVAMAPDREQLYRRIDERVDGMFEAGLVDEVRGLRERGYGPTLRSQLAIGYQEIHRLLDGDLELAEARRLVKRNSRRYARRQLSWVRNGPAAEQVEWYPSVSAVDLASLKRYLSQP